MLHSINEHDDETPTKVIDPTTTRFLAFASRAHRLVSVAREAIATDPDADALVFAAQSLDQLIALAASESQS